MTNAFTGLTYGLIAGAAGATALNAVTFADQAVRARPAGDTPGQTVNALAEAADVPVPGSPDEVQNRLEGLGPLSGLAVGLGVGAVAGLFRAVGIRLPAPVGAVLVGLGAMAISDSTMVALKISDPKSWTPSSVAADAIPHLAYGAVTVAALHRFIQD